MVLIGKLNLPFISIMANFFSHIPIIIIIIIIIIMKNYNFKIQNGIYVLVKNRYQ
jgi:hypothetical protein